MFPLRHVSAFTLIELLIVVAIISILATIALPNFIEAQTRAKVSRAHAEMRTIATALESFAVDNGGYPPSISMSDDGTSFTLILPMSARLAGLTALSVISRIFPAISFHAPRARLALPRWMPPKHTIAIIISTAPPQARRAHMIPLTRAIMPTCSLARDQTFIRPAVLFPLAAWIMTQQMAREVMATLFALAHDNLGEPKQKLEKIPGTHNCIVPLRKQL